jgi:hypothetical protein
MLSSFVPFIILLTLEDLLHSIMKYAENIPYQKQAKIK